jgi:hypothetical protein
MGVAPVQPDVAHSGTTIATTRERCSERSCCELRLPKRSRCSARPLRGRASSQASTLPWSEFERARLTVERTLQGVRRLIAGDLLLHCHGWVLPVELVSVRTASTHTLPGHLLVIFAEPLEQIYQNPGNSGTQGQEGILPPVCGQSRILIRGRRCEYCNGPPISIEQGHRRHRG